MKKPIIHEFDPVIYPTRIWVCINPTFEEVSEKFYAINNDIERMDIEKEQFNPCSQTIARTYPVSIKGDGWIGLLIGVFKPKQLKTGTICHESVHCADFICEQFGITAGKFEYGEAYAYLVGWIADCIEKVLKNKV